jgi:hypothetical protein
MGKFPLRLIYEHSQEKANGTPQKGTASRVGPSDGEPAGKTNLSVLWANLQIDWLGQPYVSALFGGAMAGNLTLRNVPKTRRRLAAREAWAVVIILSAIGWLAILTVLI